MFGNKGEAAGSRREETRRRWHCQRSSDGQINNQIMQRKTRLELCLIKMSMIFFSQHNKEYTNFINHFALSMAYKQHDIFTQCAG